MRTSILTGLAAFTTLTLAQDTYWSNQSAPFYLVIHSKNATLNGQYLGACHEGAAIEGLCVTAPSTENYVTFTYNTSTQETTPTSGLLAWSLPYNDGLTVSSAMRFSYNPASNVALPLFFPGNSEVTQVSWVNDRLTVPSYQDDSKPLPNYTNDPLFRWQVCKTYYGYPYQTLAWTLGNHSPQNPTCQKVDVVRKFV